MASLPVLFDTLNTCVMAYYKGTSLPVNRTLFKTILETVRANKYWEDIPTEALVRQLDKIEKGICGMYDAKGWQQDTISGLCQAAMPDWQPHETLTVWVGNIACLLQRGVIKNDNENGYLSVKIDAPGTRKASK
jgi:hypothetical protein